MSVVYFIQHGAAGAIKIGIAKNLRQRLHGLNTPDPLVVLATIPGGRALEKRIHAALGAHNRRNEWFNPTAEVRAVAALAKARGVEAVERWLETVASADKMRAPPAPTDDLDRDLRTFLAFAIAEIIRIHGIEATAKASGKTLKTIEGYRRQKADPGFTSLVGLIALEPAAFTALFARVGLTLIEAGEAIDSMRGRLSA